MSVHVDRVGSAPLGRHIGEIFFRRVEESGDRTFIKLQQGGGFEDVSWRDLGATVRSLIFALVDLRIGPGETVAIIGENSLEWLAADLATLAGGWPNVVISPSSSDRMLGKILAHAECRAVFVQDFLIAGRLINLKASLPALAHIFVMQENAPSLPGTLPMARLVELGRKTESGKLGEVLQAVHSDRLATIMYTSGSTGEPKGVMRTQDNLFSNITNGGEVVVSKADELFVIVLSLNHLFGRFGLLKSVVTGRTTALIEATELKLDLQVLKSLGATAMAVVPRVMERIWNGVLDQERNREIWRELEQLDRQSGAASLSDGENQNFQTLQRELKESVGRALGGRIKYITYGASAMPPSILRFFELGGIPLIGSYGSTECGGVTLCGLAENRAGSLGRPFPNVEIRCADDGEILVRGPTVTPGYFKDSEATREALDPDGWFHTGDRGVLDSDGSLRIIGRKKDVFNCADGSNIYPGFIELQLEDESFIRQAILLGDRRPFIAALIVADRDRIAEARGRAASVLSDGEIAASLWTQIDRVNRRLESYEQIRRIAVLDDEFLPAARSVNVFQKVKVDRAVVAAHYAEEIAEIYSAETEGGKP